MADDPLPGQMPTCTDCLGADTPAFVLTRWNDVGNITHNKSAILVELINKEETALFHTVSQVDTGGPHRLCAFSMRETLSLPALSRGNKYSVEQTPFQYLLGAAVAHPRRVVVVSWSQCQLPVLSVDSRI